MKQRLPMTFSKLHAKAFREKRLSLSVPLRLRNRLWQLLSDFNDSVGVQRDPNDNWIDNSDLATELLPKLFRLYGVERLEISGAKNQRVIADMKEFVASCEPEQVFDVIQLWYDDLSNERQRAMQQELNLVLEEEACPWCFCEREFFQVDSKFLEERILAQVHELLDVQGHHGAMQEFVEARNDFASGDFKGTILNACKAYESVMKTILAKDSGVADDLIKGLAKAGILDDLPRELRRPFEVKVLQAVPFMRNTFAGHGQGQQILSVSRELAELCLHLSGSFMLFCIRRQLVIAPPQTQSVRTTDQTPEDNLPF
ncbi:MAG: hypothetical protein R6X19_08680 [Kiritimatiellia bacterium]